ncbi:MAG: aspartate--tRNA ligase [Oligoflexia bacterium]|nr:aspartate--tRNA ligase [Oligoflexia bacterium]
MSSFISKLKRTHRCGSLKANDDGKTVVLMGWVNTRRDHGGLVFVDMRDREGLTQVVINPQASGLETAKNIRGEYVLAIQGLVKKRPTGMINPKIQTGEIEVEAVKLEILSEAETLPFQPDDESVNEMLRLKYRYLELRSPHLQKKLFLRSKFVHLVRNFFDQEGFIEVETPILWKSTPEGARDYLVPSRVNPGTFFALPQSPQTLKQLLMISCFDRYFQIARCFRDEDLRADRQPEFTQVDIEMSFVDADDIIDVNERAVASIWKEIKKVDLKLPLPRMTFQDAMDRFGNDKPDTRFGMEIKDISSLAQGSGFKVFDEALSRKGAVKGIAVPGGAKFSRKDFDDLTDMAKKSGAKGLVWIKWEDTFNTPIAKFFTPEKLESFCQTIGAKKGDCVLMVADDYNVVCQTLSVLRLHLGHKLKLIDTSKDALLWIIDFPLLEFDPLAKRWAARHHPFTSPQDQDLEAFVKGDEDKFKDIKAKAYDLVCNGYEIAGGSIRIHRKEVQDAMFRTLHISPEEAQHKFGFFLDALRYGTPPHGGIAWGVDRVVMILCGTEAIREVIAFPKTQKAACQMSGTPSTVSRDQLAELHVKVVNPQNLVVNPQTGVTT